MNMTGRHPRILSPEQLAQWTPAHRRMYAQRLPRSWPGVRDMLAMSERAMRDEHEPVMDLQPPPVVISWESPQPRRITVAEITEACARCGGISLTEIRSPRRARATVRLRQAAMYLATKLTSRSLPEIGRMLGGRDHSTVHHGKRKVQADLDAGGSVFGPIIAHVERELGVA